MTDNAVLTRRLFEEADHGRTPVELLTPAFTAHFTGLPTMDTTAFDQFETGFRSAFNPTHHLDDLIEQGDRVAVRLRLDGTHTSEFMGIPASNRAVSVEGTAFVRIDSGRVAELWGFTDMLGLMQQIGALPTPQAG
jgi:predicted ester cyclase